MNPQMMKPIEIGRSLADLIPVKLKSIKSWLSPCNDRRQTHSAVISKLQSNKTSYISIDLTGNQLRSTKSNWI